MFLFCHLIVLMQYRIKTLNTDNSAMEWMFRKDISYSDINEGRVYIPAEHVETFGVANGTQVAVCDAQMNNTRRMNFITRRGKSYLGKGWRKFCEEKGLREGNSINFYDLGRLEGTGKRFFRIERGVGFDLNEPPPLDN
jgi:hypothetical protein